MVPQIKQSAGKRKGSNATGRGNPYLGAALGEGAASAGRTQSFLGARYRRLTRRMPKKKALVATGNSMLTIMHALLADPDACYQDLGAALGEAGISAGNTQSFLGARYRKLTRRMPRKKALVATGNSMLTIIHALLSDPAAVYTDLGADYYEQRMHARRQARNHVKSLERLGYKVTIEPIDTATGELLTATG